MFYEAKVKSYIRVPPHTFHENTEQSIMKALRDRFENFISKDLGVVIGVTSLNEVGEGVIIPGDGAAYYETVFTLLTFKPELQEVVAGTVREINEFGAFLDIGPLDGMVHISQTMDDYVSFSKANVLTGKESKKSLKVGDLCRARIIAVSYKDMSNPKIGLTMRQPFLGKEEWWKDENKAKKFVKEDKKKEKE